MAFIYYVKPLFLLFLKFSVYLMKFRNLLQIMYKKYFVFLSVLVVVKYQSSAVHSRNGHILPCN